MMELETLLEGNDRIKLVIVRYLEMHSEKNITISELCEFVGITPFRLENAISELNNEFCQFKPIPRIKEEGGILSTRGIDLKIVKLLKLNYFKRAPTFLLLIDTLEESITAKEFSKKYFFSLASVYIRQRTLSHFLSEFGIKLSKGRIIGKEITIRNLLFSILFEIYNGIEGPFSFETSQQVKRVYDYLVYTFHLKIHKTRQVKLELLIGIVLCRIRVKSHLDKHEIFFKFTEVKDLQLEQAITVLSELLDIKDHGIQHSEISYIFGFINMEELGGMPVEIIGKKVAKLDLVSEALAEKMISYLNISPSKKCEQLCDQLKKKIVWINRKHAIFDFVLSAFTSQAQFSYFFEAYPSFSFAVNQSIELFKNELIFGDESIVNQLFYEYIFLLVQICPLDYVEKPVYVCVDFSLGELYTKFITRQIEGFRNMNIEIEHRLSSKTDIYVSDCMLQGLKLQQLIWKKPPSADDWQFFGDAVIRAKQKDEEKG